MRSIEAGVADPGRSCWRLVRARRAAALVDASRYFEVLADALCRARRSVYVVGWDLHSRVRLGRRGAKPGGADDASCEFAALLADLARWRPQLRIRLLDWDYSMLVASEREPRPWISLDRELPRQVRFRLDGRHPVGASHHQKIVVIDDALAFVGGLDLTAMRWDTPAHDPEDPRRVDPDGKPYAPFHDVQLAVDGDAAAALGVLARVRWHRAGSHRSLAGVIRAPRRSDSDPWPPGLAPDFRDVSVAIARTEPAYLGRQEVREVEQLHLDTIAAARRFLYVENQYLSSRSIGDALCASLERRDGPEIVVVAPRECSGWLEETTMAPLRHRIVRRMQAADHAGRLRLFYPRLPGDAARINVHSKLLVADDELLRVGSANLSNRSMGLDTECDLQLEARGDPAVRRGIARVRSRLLAEHLGVSPARVRDTFEATGSLVATIERLATGERRLEPLDVSIPPWIDRLVPDELIGDPERPIAALRGLEQWMPEELRDPRRRGLPAVLATIAIAALLAGAWHLPPLAAAVQPSALRAWLAELAAMPLGAASIVGVFVVTGLVAIPPALPAAATFLLFGGEKAIACSAAGIAASAAVGWGLGRMILRRPLQRLSGPRLAELRRRLSVPGVLAIAALRLVPIAPFLLVSLLAGAARLPLPGYLAGTLLGMAPLVATLALVSSAGRALRISTIANAALLGATIAAIAAFYWLERRVARRARRGPRSEPGSPPRAAGTA